MYQPSITLNEEGRDFSFADIRADPKLKNKTFVKQKSPRQQDSHNGYNLPSTAPVGVRFSKHASAKETSKASTHEGNAKTQYQQQQNVFLQDSATETMDNDQQDFLINNSIESNLYEQQLTGNFMNN